MNIIYPMDREKLILDSEVFRDYRRKESKARSYLLAVITAMFLVTSISITLAITMPGSKLESAGQHIKDYNKTLLSQNKALAAIDILYTQSCKSRFQTDFLAIFPILPKTSSIAATKPKADPVKITTTTTQVAQLPEKTQQTTNPKPATNNTTTKTKPVQTTTKKTTTTAKKTTQTTTTKPKTVAKTENKTTIARYDTVDAIPIPAMAVRPADANYGIPENWPINSPVSVPYGYRPERGRFHAGVDLDAEIGVPVEAAGAGKIIRAEWFAGYGMCVDIEHANGYVTRYGHLSQIYVKKGQWVEVGEWIGANGSTGNSSAPHVHFEVHQNGHTLDPESINWTIRKMPPKAY